MIELRAVTPDEWRIWQICRLRALTENPAAFGSRIVDWIDAPEARWRERLGLPGSVNIVAFVDGQAAGMVSGIPSDDEFVAEIISMWVAPEARGKDVGNAMIAEIQEWAEGLQVQTLRLDVFQDNARAIALYVRNGFVDAGGSPEEGERRMVKSIRGKGRSSR